MAKQTEIEATYRVTTPLFCAGADATQPELRAPSFKGVLRFWWRALAWSRLRGDLQAIKEEEDKLFGSAGSGQSRVSLRLIAESEPVRIPAKTVLTVSGTNQVVGQGARYLGYGVISKKKDTEAGELMRPCLRAPFEFTVRMRGRNLTEQQSSSLQRALIALGTLGGMGARSRKGYGSLVIRSLHMGGAKEWRAPPSIAELCNEIKAFRPAGGPTAEPDFTAVSEGSRHLLLSSSQRKPMNLLDLLGREMVRFRSWGHNGRVLDQQSERNFQADRDLMKDVKKGRPPRAHPQRIAFGLPHNYGGQKNQQIKPNDKNLDRRASPLFIHIHECGDKPVAVLSFLPAQFLPEGRSDISVGGTGVPQTPETELYRPVHEFLDRLLDPQMRKEAFAEAREVKS